MTSTQRSLAVALWALMVVSLLGLVAMMRWQSQVEAARTREAQTAVRISATQASPDVNQIEPLQLAAPAFRLTDQDGKLFDSASLAGKVYTVSFFFSQCQGVCPGMVGRIHELQCAISDPDIHNVYLTVDPERDTPERLHAYGQTVNADPTRWHLLTGTSEQMHKVASEFGKAYDAPSQHSAAIILVDRAGKLVGFYESRHPEEMLRLADDAHRVLADKPATQPTVCQSRDDAMTIASLPLVNAIFNGLSAILLTVGYVLIRQRRMRAHGMVMLAALVSSSLFLAGYLVHKWYYPDVRVMTRFPHLPEPWRIFYLYVVLFPHLVLAVGMLPFIATGLYHAYKRQFEKHRRVNRVTIWIWLYVSVTGVLIYVLLYQLFPAINAAHA